MITQTKVGLPARRRLQAAASAASILLVVSGLVWLWGSGRVGDLARNLGIIPDGRATVRNEKDARARYRSTGTLITREEAVLIAKEHLRQTGMLVENERLDWQAELYDGTWLVLARQRPATPGGDFLVRVTQEGTVLDSAPGA
jgi:hypothetical protein